MSHNLSLIFKRDELHSNTPLRGLPNGNVQSCVEAKGRDKGKASAGKIPIRNIQTRLLALFVASILIYFLL